MPVADGAQEISAVALAGMVAVAVQDLLLRTGLNHDDPVPVEISTVASTPEDQVVLLLRRGDRVYRYQTGPLGQMELDPSGERDGGRMMVRPPRMDL